MLKKILMALAVAGALTQSASAQTLKVVATNGDIAAICRQIAGPLAEVALLVPPTMNPHYMPLRPSMLQKLREADLMMTVGLDHEPWLLDALNASGNGGVQSGSAGYVDCSEGIRLINVPTGGVNRGQGDLHIFGNTHYWTDPGNGKIMAVHIMQALARKLPAKNEELRGRARQLLVDLDKKTAEWKTRMARHAGAPIVIYHQAMDYLIAFLGLKLVGYVEMRVGVEPSPAHVERLQATMRQHGVKIIAMEPYFNKSQASTVAAGAGAKVVVVPGSTGENQTYVEFLDELISKVQKGLEGGTS